MIRALFSVLTLTALTSLASAQASEHACRSAESDNFARCNGDGTATGRLTDVIIIKNNEGRVIVQATVDWFRRNLPYYVYKRGEPQRRPVLGPFQLLVSQAVPPEAVRWNGGGLARL